MIRTKNEESNLVECEVISYGKNGEPPRPIKIKAEIDGQIMLGRIIKVRDRTLERYNGNIMFRYFCDAVLEDRPILLELKYERDTMNWYMYKPGTTQGEI